MIRLVIKLSGKAEEDFSQLLEEKGATQDNITELLIDALALLDVAVTETANGKKLAIFDPQTKEVTLLTIPSLKESKKMQAKMVMHHDDQLCKERLDGRGYCPECRYVPDMQNMCFHYYCPNCDIELKDMVCPTCKQTFEPAH